MKRKYYISLAVCIIALSINNTYAINENLNDSIKLKREISIDISYVFQQLLNGKEELFLYGNNNWTSLGVDYEIISGNNNAFGIGVNYGFISGEDPPRLLGVTNSTKIFYLNSLRRKDLALNVGYEFRNKINNFEFVYGISFFGSKNSHQYTASRFEYSGDDFLMNHVEQSEVDVDYYEQLSTISYSIGIDLDVGMRFPISRHFTFITSCSLPFKYNFGKSSVFNIYTKRYDEINIDSFNIVENLKGKISLAYLF